MNRAAARVVLLALLAGCQGSAPGLSPTGPPSRTPSPNPEAAAATAAALAPESAAPAAGAMEGLPIGVQIFEADVTAPVLERLRAAGVRWARVRALWKLVERERRTPPVYDWTVTDRLFGDAVSAGMRNVAVVYANPPWVTARECLPVPAEHLARYAALWTALVERYDGDGVADAPNGATVRTWQVSNEADFDPTAPGEETDYGGCFGNDPPAYAEQLVLAYRAAKAADPGAQVGFGPVAFDRFTADSAPADWTAPPGPFVYDFTSRVLEHLYGAHAGEPDLPYFDFVGLHNYNDNAHFWDGSRRPLEQELVGKVRRFRDEQLALPGVFDLRATPILISETGFASFPSDEWTARSEALQAAYLGQTMVRGLAVHALATIWYTARDNLMGDCAPPHWDWMTFGLMRSGEVRQTVDERCPMRDWLTGAEYAASSEDPAAPKPALEALATVVKSLRGRSFQRQLAAEDMGTSDVEAYLFGAGKTDVTASGPGQVLAAWTTTGERLGKRDVAPIIAELQVDGRLLAPWTGVVTLTDGMGQTRQLGTAGAASVAVPLDEAPVFVAVGR